ncbi:MAG TPA: ABC transporter permease [Thermoanaerobaculia bacterium]|jgi:predicted permease|nr:ABC transporter permease [Thermoanaerobaculia bacterium]
MRIYRALLTVYPASFRRQYGAEMLGIFARRRREAAGPLAAARLWAATLCEVLGNAAAVHWDLLRQDLRYTARGVRRAPGFAVSVLLVVALGIGANTAAFTVTDFVLVRPLPFPEPERLVKLWESRPGYERMEPSPANYRDWKRMSSAFESMGAFTGTSVNLVGHGDPVRLEGAEVTAEVLPLLGVRPLLGRFFTAAEDRPGSGGTVLLSYRLWQDELGGDPHALGRRVTLDGAPFVVIGVMPPEFHFPDRRARLWMPARLRDQHFLDRNDNWLEVVAKRKRGISLAAARAEMAVVAARLERQYPKEDAHTGALVIGLREELSQQSRLLLLALSGAALCVLLIACANLAGLLLARALARRQELEVRAALGAGRERLLRQLVTESLALAVLGGALGILVAAASVPLLARLAPASLPIAQAPAIDSRVLLFAVLLTAATGIGFGLVPAVRACREADFAALREGGARGGGGRRERLRAALVMVEVTASVVLLISSGLLIRALWRLQATDPGFRAENVLTLRTALPTPKYASTARRAAFYQRVLTGVRALPGVDGAAYASFLPMVHPGSIFPVALEGQPMQREAAKAASLRFVTPGYFAAMGIPLRRGRDVSEADARERPSVAVVSDSFVRRYWPDQEPLGRHFQFAFAERTVVGVAGDVRVRGLDRSSEPQVYLSYLQVPDGGLAYYAPKDLVVRSAASAEALLPPLRQVIREADPEQPISEVRTLAAIVADQTASRLLQLRVLGAFAAIAFLLAGIGIHGLLACAVSQRAREIGVRRALGAQSADILTMVLRSGVLTAAMGVAPGLALAYGAGKAMQALLAGVEPGDAPTFAAAALLCLLMTASGSVIPALRALRVDPMTVVRTE